MESYENRQTDNSNVYHATSELLSVEADLISYNKYLVDRFITEFEKISSPIQREGRVLDFGAGIGTLSIIWKERRRSPTPTCFEIDPKQIEILIERGFEVISEISQAPESYDFIFTSNVLEHIEFDRQALSNLHNLIQHGGALVVYVPAFQSLYSDLDSIAGHYRRYSKKELVSKLRDSGFSVERIEYVDSVGFFAALVLKILGWKKFGNLGDSRSLKFYDQHIFPISRVLDQIGFKYFLGKNIYAVARKNLPTNL